MATPDPKVQTSVQIKRTLRAPRAKIFEAFTSPEALKRWWMPGDGFSVPSAEVDLREGGAYRIGMKNLAGKIFHLFGTYREVKPPEKIVYSWQWDGIEEKLGETLVTVELHDVEGGTELVVTHELFPTTEDRDNHNKGWSGCLDHLEKMFCQG
ncbi:MAG: SRPBCC domain-containing protein [Deltaproteobacteria bacterium]|nr:SRPBCC domain-containing protein [Deltaproteobacteria bacterium]